MSLPSIKYFTQAGGHLKKELAEYYLKYALANKNYFILCMVKLKQLQEYPTCK